MLDKLKEQQEKKALAETFGLISTRTNGMMPIELVNDFLFEHTANDIKLDLWRWVKGYMGCDTGPDTPVDRSNTLFRFEQFCELIDALYSMQEELKECA